MTSVETLRRDLSAAPVFERRGRIVHAFGDTVRVTGVPVAIGQTCRLIDPRDGHEILAEVIGLDANGAVLTVLEPLRGLSLDAEVAPGQAVAQVPFGQALLGRIIDAYGRPLDGKGPLGAGGVAPIYGAAPALVDRRPVEAVFSTGVSAIDLVLTGGVGQRTGIFAAAGGGKSTLLGMIARQSGADVNVIGLIGERGREVAEFVESALGPLGLARSVLVVATSDRPAMERARAANAATGLAEAFRDRGGNVLLLMDSVTRYARALRELGLGMGEPPVRRGYPASMFAELPRLFERGGRTARGAITAYYTVLLEDEQEHDPVGEEVRSILDGHIYLTRKIAESGRYPAIDLLKSVSRLFERLAGEEQIAAARRLRLLLGKFEALEFLRQVGEYAPGADPDADLAVSRHPQIEQLLAQGPWEQRTLAQDLSALTRLMEPA